MVTSQEVKFKGIKCVPAGSFTNEKGQQINYKETYRIIFDQIINGLPKETFLKIPKEHALNIGQNFKLYDDVIITFNVIIYSSNNISVTLKDIRKK